MYFHRLSAPRINGDSRHETGFRAIWVATRETAYLDPLLWDNAGSVEGGVFHSRSHRDGNLIVALRAEGVGGVAYRHGEANSGGQYEQQGFGRFTGELSVRRRFGPFVAGVRGYAGAFLSADPPPAQRAIPVSGADPYQTLSNPWIRSEGALLSGGDVFYQAPGHANLRGYRPGASGRWVGSVNLELEGDLYRADRGVLRRASLLGFWDGGLADTLVVRSFEGRAYRILVDGGVGARVWLAIGALHFPIRIEFPLYVSEPAISLDRDRTVEFVDFRWLISVQPIF